ncbi:MAG: DUF2865 domain-containing protein [Hyphomicrobiales bacterium]|nr:DUF2865 domain-containing protein [Hyphomicrobiales bacterium]
MVPIAGADHWKRRGQLPNPDLSRAADPQRRIVFASRREVSNGQDGTKTNGAVSGLALLIATCLCASSFALAQAPTCSSLQAQWAALNRKDAGRAGAIANAAQRQNAELQRSAAYARQIGCDNRRFLIFGSDPPPQCGPLLARMARMQQDLANLQSQADRLGGGAALDEQRYQLQLAMRQYCGGEARPSGILGQPGEANLIDVPQAIDGLGGTEPVPGGGLGKPVCVRLCDGYFFPLASVGSRGGVDAAQMCQAQCPGADTEAFSMGAGDDIEHAVGEGGKAYMELENALRYQKATVPGCSCRKSDQSWGQALKPAEDMLGGSDTMIDADKAAQMSRPANPSDAKKPAGARTGPAPTVSAAPLPDLAASRDNGGHPAGQTSAPSSPGEPPKKVRIIPVPSATQPAQSAQP